ncbi:ABC transporter ATP-binding protein [Elusimicrobiota bacterium]
MHEKALTISGLTVKFGDFTAVNNVSFSVNRGEIFGFLGANGAGKTTSIRVMCGLLIPTSGNVDVSGKDFSHGAFEIKKKVGYMSQKFTLYDDLTVVENLDFKGALRKLPKDYVQKRITELFGFIGFNYSADTFVRDLPSGVKQQVSLCASLLHDPEIIFLDEPTSGVSPSMRKKFWSLIKKLSSEGKTIIVTTHYMDEAEECERIALMRSGEIIALDSPSGLKQHAYPEPLIEVSFNVKDKKELINAILTADSVEKGWPYGLKYHIALKNKSYKDDFITKLPDNCTAKEIDPSLEDVFVKLVEGASR